MGLAFLSDPAGPEGRWGAHKGRYRSHPDHSALARRNPARTKPHGSCSHVDRRRGTTKQVGNFRDMLRGNPSGYDLLVAFRPRTSTVWVGGLRHAVASLCYAAEAPSAAANHTPQKPAVCEEAMPRCTPTIPLAGSARQLAQSKMDRASVLVRFRPIADSGAIVHLRGQLRPRGNEQ